MKLLNQFLIMIFLASLSITNLSAFSWSLTGAKAWFTGLAEKVSEPENRPAIAIGAAAVLTGGTGYYLYKKSHQGKNLPAPAKIIAMPTQLSPNQGLFAGARAGLFGQYYAKQAIKIRLLKQEIVKISRRRESTPEQISFQNHPVLVENVVVPKVQNASVISQNEPRNELIVDNNIQLWKEGEDPKEIDLSNFEEDAVFLSPEIFQNDVIMHSPQESDKPHSVWFELEKESVAKAFDQDIVNKKIVRVRRGYRFIPENKTTDKKALYIVVHGTWAHKGKEYYDVTNREFKAIRKFAKQEAEKNGQVIDLLAWCWTGEDLHIDRTASGQSLADVLTRTQKNYSHITTVAHSHGANVVNIASNIIDFDIDRMIHFAAPVVTTDPNYMPFRVKEVINFLSTGDIVQYLGSIDRNLPYGSGLFKGGSCRNYPLKKGKTILNIRTQINGSNPDHSGIRAASLEHLGEILSRIEKHYPFQDYFDLNIRTTSLRNKSVAADPIILTLREKRTPKEMLNQYGIDLYTAQQTFGKHMNYSTQQEYFFTQQYKASIHDKGVLRLPEQLGNLRLTIQGAPQEDQPQPSTSGTANRQ